MNSTPADSNAERTAKLFALVKAVLLSASSARRIVRKLTGECLAKLGLLSNRASLVNALFDANRLVSDAGIRVVSVVGINPPHDGRSRMRPSRVFARSPNQQTSQAPRRTPLSSARHNRVPARDRRDRNTSIRKVRYQAQARRWQCGLLATFTCGERLIVCGNSSWKRRDRNAFRDAISSSFGHSFRYYSSVQFSGAGTTKMHARFFV